MHRVVRILIDLVLVGVFAAIGRASHAEALTGDGVLRTALPFVGGTLLVWIWFVLKRQQFTPLREGVFVWAATLVLGMVFRVLIGDGTAPAFIAVAGATLALFLIGWRAVWWLATRRRPVARARAKNASRSGNPAVRDRARRER